MRSLILALALAATPALAQNVTHVPEGSWRTVHTDHYRLHYPLDAEDWAIEVAGQLDGIRARVSEEVGYMPPRKVDLVVMDPYRDSNGFAIPFMGRPRMGVFATPPGASSALGNYRTWAEDLVVHEDAHLVHLMRPTRSGFRGFFSGLVGMGPVTTQSPAWVVEGYATVVEGRLTGLGRPNGDYRALMLRSLAQEGRMPGYGALDGGSGWASGRFRYLVGSAFLEWLENHSHDGALNDLWARLTARKKRKFGGAFKGVFGESPQVLYGRYLAELTRDAMAIEAARPLHEGREFADLSGGTGSPTLSADGTQLAAVISSADGPSRLVVWSTEPDAEAAERWEESVAELLEADPEDVPSATPEVFAPKELHRRMRNDRGVAAPRFLADGRLLFASWTTNGQGFGRPDLYIWDPEGDEQRVTRGASLTEADPHPDGERAFAVRTDWGVQSLVEVDLQTGAVTEVLPESTAVIDAPRVSPDGERLAYLINSGEIWELRVRDLDSGDDRKIELPEGMLAADPAWLPDGEGLVVSLGHDGFIELAIVRDDREPEVFTATRGGAYAPTVGEQETFFLTMDAEGLDLRRIGTPGAPPVEETPEAPDEESAESAADEGSAEDPVDEESAEDVADEESAENTADEESAEDTADEESAEDTADEESAEDTADEESAEDVADVESAEDVADEESAEDPVDEESAEDAGEEERASDSTDEEDVWQAADTAQLAPLGPLALRPEPPPPIGTPETEEVEAKRYAYRQQVRPLAGFTLGNHSGAGHIMLVSEDIAGKLDLFAAGGLTSKRLGGSDGLALAATWRGPFDVRAHGYRVRELGRGVVQARQGVTASLGRRLIWHGGSAEVALAGLVDMPFSDDLFGVRQLGILDGGLSHRAWLGTMALGLELGGHFAMGQTDDAPWSRSLGQAKLGFGGRGWMLSGEQVVGAVAGGTDLDAFRLGGMRNTLVPEVMHHNQILAPAFVAGAAFGDNRRSTAVELDIQGTSAGWQRHAIGDDHVDLLVVSSRIQLDPTPLIGMPGIDVDAGASCTLADLDGKVPQACTHLRDYAAWAAVVWRP